MIGQTQVELKTIWEAMEEPKFPCLFVPIQFYADKLHYEFNKSFITNCKIRGAGHYFKMVLVKSAQESWKTKEVLTKEEIVADGWVVQSDYGAGTTYRLGDMYELMTNKHAGITYDFEDIAIFKIGIFDHKERIYIGHCYGLDSFREICNLVKIPKIKP